MRCKAKKKLMLNLKEYKGYFLFLFGGSFFWKQRHAERKIITLGCVDCWGSSSLYPQIKESSLSTPISTQI